MQNLTRVVRVGTAILASVVLCCGLALPLARATGPAFAQSIPSLAVREIKITGDELIVLQATTDIADLSEYWVGYTGSDTANPGSIVPTQQLPPRPLRAGQALLLTSDGGATCDAVLTTKLSVSLADTKGTFVVRHLASDGMSSTFTTVDSVNWAKPAASGTTTAQLDLRKETAIPTPVWYHNAGGAHPWRVGSLAGCTLTLASLAAGTVAEVVEWGQSPVEPLAIIENINEVVPTPDEQAIPAENTGLMSPLITELLANPSGTGTDATDEFIELYNPNDRAFGLAGFTLQTGLSTKHSYVLPAGLVIPAKSFRALYASETGLSMSNTSGQATLLDAQGVVVTQSDPYDSAPDGQAWALAQGVWYWTTKPTPAATNIIAQPIAKPATAVTKLLATAGKTASVKKPAASTAKTASVKGASTKKPAKTVKKTTKELASTNASQTVPVAKPTGVHPAALAVVALGALGYGAYAYRRDMAHAFQRVGRHRIFRRVRRG